MTDHRDDPRDLQDRLDSFYADLASVDLQPLWTQTKNLLPGDPRSRRHPVAVAGRDAARTRSARARDLITIERGGERRVLALANPGLGGAPFATPTLWGAIQALGPHETRSRPSPHRLGDPVRPRGRRRVDDRRRRRVPHASRRPRADPRVDVPRPHERGRRSHDRGSTASTSHSSTRSTPSSTRTIPTSTSPCGATTCRSRSMPAAAFCRTEHRHDGAALAAPRVPVGAERLDAHPPAGLQRRSRWRASSSPTPPPANRRCRR